MGTQHLRVYLETGRTWTFAAAVDWPGWCRRGRGEEGALDALLAYADRYAAVAGTALAVGEPEVIARVPGTATTDFGAPDVPAPGDEEPLAGAELARHLELLDAGWACFDAVVAAAPPTLRRGPRGGGRDRDAIVAHVREAERSFAARIGPRVPPRTAWPGQRASVRAALAAGAPGARWPARYALRRIAWHALDHAWEIEDRR